MTSELPAAASWQQPFPNQQLAPVTAASQATSPPTKQSLKSWWKGFRPPTKSQDTPGKYFSYRPPSLSQMRNYFFSDTFVSKIPRNLDPLFQESDMDGTILLLDGLLSEEASPASSVRETSNERFCFQRFKSTFTSKRHSSSFLGETSNRRRFRQQISASVKDATQRSISVRKSRFGRSRTFTAGNKSDSSAFLEAGILPSPQSRPPSHFFNNLYFSRLCLAFSEDTAKETMQIVEQPAGIFGVPLRQSITYANVAISLVDAEGKSYIYGYVPIVVAKCGVYLKEHATNVEGIFRLSGSEKRIKELKTIFDSPDRYGKGLDWTGYTVHDAANVLRRYLNLLPEPIVPLDLYDRFREPLRGHTMQAVGDTEGPQLEDNFDIGKAISTYQQLITELPPLNRQLLLYILDLLAVFASKSDENRMNSQNLAAIFQPGMLSHPSHDMAPVEYRLSQDVLIFLIENQDHFLIGMRGTAADEQTVQEVQNGGTPPPGTPNTPGKAKNLVKRSGSNASAGADSVRKYGGLRRNVSVSSRQSNGAPSPASPAYGVALSQTSSGGIHRSNTVPSKKSPGLSQGRLQKNSGSTSPAAAGIFAPHQTAPRGLSPSAPTETTRSVSPSSHVVPPTVTGLSSLAPSSHAASAVTSQDRLLGDEKQPDVATPTRERNMTSFFQRSPTTESEKKQPNKLKKRRIPSSSNPSAQSSTHSLHGPQSYSDSPGLHPALDAQDLAGQPHLESIPSANAELSNTEHTPASAETSRAGQPPTRPQEYQQASDKTLKPIASPTSSLHSRSSFNDQSDVDHVDETAVAAERREKRSRWRLSRRREDTQPLGNALSPKKGLGADPNAGASSSSVGSSSRPRKSFTGDTVPVGSESTLPGTHLQSSNDSGPSGASSEEKKGPLGWIKNKMREKREEKETEKGRNKSPPAITERLASALPTTGKSIEIKREENPERSTEPPIAQPQR